MCLFVCVCVWFCLHSSNIHDLTIIYTLIIKVRNDYIIPRESDKLSLLYINFTVIRSVQSYNFKHILMKITLIKIATKYMMICKKVIYGLTGVVYRCDYRWHTGVIYRWHVEQGERSDTLTPAWTRHAEGCQRCGGVRGGQHYVLPVWTCWHLTLHSLHLLCSAGKGVFPQEWRWGDGLHGFTTWCLFCSVLLLVFWLVFNFFGVTFVFWYHCKGEMILERVCVVCCPVWKCMIIPCLPFLYYSFFYREPAITSRLFLYIFLLPLAGSPIA